jgi:hypothetical protein
MALIVISGLQVTTSVSCLGTVPGADHAARLCDVANDAKGGERGS